MKYSLFSVMVPDWNPETTVRSIAACGYDGIEWRVTDTDPKLVNAPVSYWGRNLCTLELSQLLETAEQVYGMTQRAGLETAALAGYHKLADLASTEKMLAAARLMQAPLIRVNPQLYAQETGYDALFESDRSSLEKIVPMALDSGVRVCVETHPRNITPSASAARRLLDGLDPEAVGVIFDPGNMVTEGYEDTRMGLDILGPYLAHVHVKNSAWYERTDAGNDDHPWQARAVSLDGGIIDWLKVLSDLEAVGYAGYLSFEDFSDSRDGDEKVRFNIDHMKSLAAGPV